MLSVECCVEFCTGQWEEDEEEEEEEGGVLSELL